MLGDKYSAYVVVLPKIMATSGYMLGYIIISSGSYMQLSPICVDEDYPFMNIEDFIYTPKEIYPNE